MALRYLKQDRSLALRGSILLTDGTTHALSADNVVRYHIDETSTGGEAITIGDTRAAEYTLVIEDAAHSLTAAQLLGAKVTMEIGIDGTFDPLGVWTISRTRISRQSATVDLSGADALSSETDALYVDGTYPATLGQIAQRAANQAGLTLKSASFRNSGVSVASMPEWDPETNSVRAVIGYVAGCAGGFARIDRAGLLEIVPYNTRTAGEVGADYFATLNVGMGRSFAFNCLQVMHYGTNIYTRYAIKSAAEDTAGNTLRISDNPLMTANIAQSLVSALTGMNGQAISADWVGDPTVQTGAVLTFVDTDGARYPGIVTGQTVEIDGGLHMTTDADLPETISATYATDTLYTPSGKVNITAIEGRLKVWAENEIDVAVGAAANNLQTQINAVPGQITAAVSDASNKLQTQISQTAGAIRSEVADDIAKVNSAISQTAAAIRSEVTDEVNDLQSQINQTPDLISAAVGGIQIGGTNLLRETGWYTEVAPRSVGWIYTHGAFIEYPYDTLPDRDDFYENGFIHWTGEKAGDCNTPWRETKAGEVYTLSFRHRGAGLTVFIVGLNAVETQTWGPSKSFGNASTKDCSFTFTIPSDRDVSAIYAVFRTTAGQAGVLGRIKLERGNKATAWSPNPLDNSRGVQNGSDLLITKDVVRINTPELEINVSGENGDAHFGANGLSVDKVNSPSVYAQYDGPIAIYVTGSANGVDSYATLSDVFARLSNKHLPSEVTINVNTSYTDGEGVLQNVSGADIVIHGHGNTIAGAFDMNSVQSRVMIDNLHISYAAANPWDLFNCSYVYMQWCIITANRSVSQWVGGINVQNGTTLTLESCTVNNAYVAVNIYYGSRVSATNCNGSNNTYAFVVRHMSTLGMRGFRPPGSILVDGDAWAGTDPGASSTDAPAAPEATTTVTLNATNSRTYAGGWYSGTNVLSQGASGGTTFQGFMWFDTSAIAGKTIKSAAIRLYRRAGVGSGNPVKVLVGSHNASGPSGATNLVNGFNDYIVGMVDQKEELKASISAEAVQQIANGSAKGLYIHSDSNGYAQFDGFDGEHPPKLLVTYV